MLMAPWMVFYGPLPDEAIMPDPEREQAPDELADAPKSRLGLATPVFSVRRAVLEIGERRRLRRDQGHTGKVSSYAREIAGQQWRLLNGCVRADEKIRQHTRFRAAPRAIAQECLARQE